MAFCWLFAINSKTLMRYWRDQLRRVLAKKVGYLVFVTEANQFEEPMQDSTVSSR